MARRIIQPDLAEIVDVSQAGKLCCTLLFMVVKRRTWNVRRLQKHSCRCEFARPSAALATDKLASPKRPEYLQLTQLSM